MNVLSNWKLTYSPYATPVVLLDYLSELADEPEFALRRGLEVVSIPYGAPFLRPTKNDVYEVAISISHASESDANARRDMLNYLVDFYDQTDRMPMWLEIAGLTTHYYRWSSVFIHSASVKRVVAEGRDGEWQIKFGFTGVDCIKINY